VGTETRRIGLPTKNGKIMCAIVREDRDVAPPDVILMGATKDRFRRGKALCDNQDLGNLHTVSCIEYVA
jgi:hypothetical protein